jgi:hypothetical protein
MSKKERNQSIEHQYSQGVDVSELSKNFNLSSGTIRNIVLALGGSRTEAIKQSHQCVATLVDEGKTQAQVAKLLSVSPARISYIMTNIRKLEKKQPGQTPG